MWILMRPYNPSMKEYMKGKTYVNRPKRMDEWYHEVCRAAKKRRRKEKEKKKKKVLGSYYVNFANL